MQTGAHADAEIGIKAVADFGRIATGKVDGNHPGMASSFPGTVDANPVKAFQAAQHLLQQGRFVAAYRLQAAALQVQQARPQARQTGAGWFRQN